VTVITVAATQRRTSSLSGGTSAQAANQVGRNPASRRLRPFVCSSWYVGPPEGGLVAWFARREPLLRLTRRNDLVGLRRRLTRLR
jgi:hypothetical protein